MGLGMDGYGYVHQTARQLGRLCNDTNSNVYSCLLMKLDDYLYIVIQ